MASTHKTSLGLPKWVLSDKPDMTDYNDAFEKIDAELVKKADVGVPTIYSLSFNPGFSSFYASGFFKTEFGVVTIFGNIQKANENFALGDILATIPPEFRPASIISAPATYTSASTTIVVTSDGDLIVPGSGNTIPAINRLSFNFSYIAAQ